MIGFAFENGDRLTEFQVTGKLPKEGNGSFGYAVVVLRQGRPFS